MKPEDESSPRDKSDRQSDAERIVDELLLDALLKGRYQDTRGTTAERVERVCHALETAPRVIPLRWKAGLSTAGAAVVILGLILTLRSPQSAQADLAPILAAFDTRDKTYHIDIIADANEPTPRRGFGRRQPARRPAFISPRRGLTAGRLDDATLYIRGGRYVLTCRTGRGGRVTKGFDGSKSWLVYPWGAATRADDPNLLTTDLPDHISCLLLLNLRDMLRQISATYIVSGPSAGALDDGGMPVEYYLAERIQRRGETPRRIELWVTPSTHELQQIICTGVQFHGPRTARYTWQISLVNTNPLPQDWFTQEAHQKENSRSVQ